MAKFWVGCSGWNYPEWAGAFYPAGVGKRDWLRHYASAFSCVELNYSFYHLPLEKTLRRWRQEAPGLRWAAKASRFITHIRRLQDVAEPVRTFVTRLSLVCPRGPVLFQLPPSLKYDAALLEDFLAVVPRGIRCALECRHASWLQRDCWQRLRRAGMAWCISDTAGRYPTAEEVTAPFVYLRLHGHEELYVSSYSPAQLKAWARKLRSWGRESYVYFDNTAKGHAVANARRLADLLG